MLVNIPTHFKTDAGPPCVRNRFGGMRDLANVSGDIRDASRTEEDKSFRMRPCYLINERRKIIVRELDASAKRSKARRVSTGASHSRLSRPLYVFLSCSFELKNREAVNSLGIKSQKSRMFFFFFAENLTSCLLDRLDESGFSNSERSYKVCLLWFVWPV